MAFDERWARRARDSRREDFSGAQMIRNEFWQLCAECQRLYDGTIDSRDLEVGLRGVLEFVKRRPENRADFQTYFIDLLRNRSKGPIEIVSFCMHELRWPEVLVAVKNMLNAAGDDWTTKTAMAQVVDAYGDDWEDADLYVYFGGPDRLRKDSSL